ncbi:hypothetical protein, partial [Escherichia coli]|uniref:hypothetical protein n=1 Tax=Escherichia coli TaxID=562 RepID=UPI003909311A
MHTPIGVKPVAGSKEWREAGEKKGFVSIFKGYKKIFIFLFYTSPRPPERGWSPFASFSFKKKKQTILTSIIVRYTGLIALRYTA